MDEEISALQYYFQLLVEPLQVTVPLCYGTVVLSVCNVGILWPNRWMDQDATW